MTSVPSLTWRSIFLLASIIYVTSCEPKVLEIRQEISVQASFTEGVMVYTVNGKELKCSLEKSVIAAGEEIVLRCSNDTDFDAKIDVSINGMRVGSIHAFPAEFHYLVEERGLYKLTISGMLESRNSIGKSTSSFTNSWNVTVE